MSVPNYPYQGVLVANLAGAWVTYDQQPYQMGSPECDRLERRRIGFDVLYRLDEQALLDLIQLIESNNTAVKNVDAPPE